MDAAHGAMSSLRRGWVRRLVLALLMTYVLAVMFRIYIRKYYIWLPDYVSWSMRSEPKAAGPVQGLVQQLVRARDHGMGPRDLPERDGLKLGRQRFYFFCQRFEMKIFDPVSALQLIHDQLAVRMAAEAPGFALARQLERPEHGFVLRLVVGPLPDRFGGFLKDFSVVITNNNSDGGGSGVAPSAPIGKGLQ